MPDKTGTITEGKPRVTDIRTADGLRDGADDRRLVEKPSEHPLSTAIVEARGGTSLRAVTGFQRSWGRASRPRWAASAISRQPQDDGAKPHRAR
ncbi:MAG: HAD family hydrolase [Anaerotruncus massiliensis (ex Togo et al. 2019)]